MSIENPSTDLVYGQERDLGWVDEGLDFDYVDHVGADVASTLANDEVAEVAYQPGDGTYYGLVFVPLRLLRSARPRVKDGRAWERHAVRDMFAPLAVVERRHGSAYDPRAYDPNGYLIVWVEHAAYPLQLGDRGTLAASYVAEHWNTSPVSACSLAILFRAVSHYLDKWHDVGRPQGGAPCTCEPGRGGGSADRTLRGPSHAPDCPLFSTGQEAASAPREQDVGRPQE